MQCGLCWGCIYNTQSSGTAVAARLLELPVPLGHAALPHGQEEHLSCKHVLPTRAADAGGAWLLLLLASSMRGGL